MRAASNYSRLKLKINTIMTLEDYSGRSCLYYYNASVRSNFQQYGVTLVTGYLYILTKQPTNQLRGARTRTFITAFTTAHHRPLF
jgi:hypothetical protein